MRQFIDRLFRLQAGETILLLVFGCVLLFNSLSQQLSEIMAISTFLSAGGVNQILLVWMVDSLVILVMTVNQSLVIDRFNRVNLARSVIAGLGLSYVVLNLLYALNVAPWLTSALLYIVSEQQLVFFPIVFWILASDVFSMAQSTRLFPLISGFGFTGQLVGILIAAAAPRLMQAYPAFRPQGLLAFIVLTYVAAFLILTLGLRNVRLRAVRQTQEKVKDTLTEGLTFVRQVPVFRYLALSILALLVCDAVIEFRFLVVSDAAFPDAAAYQIFYSTYRLGLMIVTLVLQGFVTSRLITRLDLKNTFLVKPISVLVGLLVMFFQPGLAGGIGGAMLLRLSQYTVDDSTRKSFQALVPEERRGRVSIFIDSYLYVIGTIFGSGVVWLMLWAARLGGYSGTFYIYLGLGLVCALLAIGAVIRLRQVYDSSMLNWRLKRRQRGKSILDRVDF